MHELFTLWTALSSEDAAKSDIIVSLISHTNNSKKFAGAEKNNTNINYSAIDRLHEKHERYLMLVSTVNYMKIGLKNLI